MAKPWEEQGYGSTPLNYSAAVSNAPQSDYGSVLLRGGAALLHPFKSEQPSGAIQGQALLNRSQVPFDQQAIIPSSQTPAQIPVLPGQTATTASSTAPQPSNAKPGDVRLRPGIIAGPPLANGQAAVSPGSQQALNSAAAFGPSGPAALSDQPYYGGGYGNYSLDPFGAAPTAGNAPAFSDRRFGPIGAQLSQRQTGQYAALGVQQPGAPGTLAGQVPYGLPQGGGYAQSTLGPQGVNFGANAGHVQRGPEPGTKAWYDAMGPGQRQLLSQINRIQGGYAGEQIGQNYADQQMRKAAAIAPLAQRLEGLRGGQLENEAALTEAAASERNAALASGALDTRTAMLGRQADQQAALGYGQLDQGLRRQAFDERMFLSGEKERASALRAQSPKPIMVKLPNGAEMPASDEMMKWSPDQWQAFYNRFSNGDMLGASGQG